MAELKIRNGDYLCRGDRLETVDGTEGLLQRVLFKLSARRGKFPFQEDLGSRLWQLSRIAPSRRQAAATQYVAEALQDEPLTVENVQIRTRADETMELTAALRSGEQLLSAVVEIR